MDNKNSQYLIIFKEKLFDKIKNFFKGIFKNEKEIIEYVPEEVNFTEEEEYEKNKCKSYENYLSQHFENQEIIDDIDCYQENEEDAMQCKNREEFFDLYEKVKNKEKSIEEVSTLDLIKMEEIIKEENSLYKKIN